ncbi:MAG: Hsp70 family protein [Planctomycetes bacterium]|nr:Hsp70 family protein [Planctomycetota bacterium]
MKEANDSSENKSSPQSPGESLRAPAESNNSVPHSDPLQQYPRSNNETVARTGSTKTTPNHAVTRIVPQDNSDSGDEFELQAEFVPLQNTQPQQQLPMLGDYVLIEKIGAGGMGEVFRAEHHIMHRQVALKILPTSLSSNQSLVDRFYAEVRAVARLMHPNIVTAFDAGQHQGIHFLVMELIEGVVLSRRISEQGPLSASEAIEVLRQAATALDYAHRLGIIHRDIKPSNMMMNRQGVLKILDFGLAQIGEAVESKNSSSRLIGTVEFMSPEQISRPDSVDHRSDLYSLGATLFYLLTGRMMFSGDPMQIAQAQVRQQPPALYEVRPDIDLRVDAIFQKLIAKNPDDRLRSGKELLENLERLNLLTSHGSAQAAAAKVLLPKLVTESSTNPGTVITRMNKNAAAFAIDLGMMNSSAAIFDKNEGPKLVPLPGGQELLRNMIWSQENQIYLGADAIARRQIAPEKVYHGLQRWLGLPYLDRPFCGRIVPPEVPVAVLLKYLANATATIQNAATHAVVTVPACYDQLRRYSVLNACKIAGIEVLQLLDRPMAAALAWLDISAKLNSPERPREAEQNWLLIHAGASGIEVSVAAIRGLEIRCLATVGDWLRGTYRWQHLLAEHLCQQFQKKFGTDVRQDIIGATRLQRTVELSLDRLATASKVDIRFEFQQKSIQCTLSRREMLAIAEEPCLMLKHYVENALKQSGIDPFDIDQVLWMGSLARFDELRSMIERFLSHNPTSSLQSKADLAIGAAIQSQHMMPTIQAPPALPRVVTSATYDLGLLFRDAQSGKTVPRVLAPKGSPLPFSIQRNMRPPPGADLPPLVQIIEGTNQGESTWHKLGQLDLKSTFANRPQRDPCQLRLQIDESGLWNGTVTWVNGQQTVPIPITSESPMTNEQAERWKSWLETILLCTPSSQA